jgi:hypothetical protein
VSDHEANVMLAWAPLHAQYLPLQGFLSVPLQPKCGEVPESPSDEILVRQSGTEMDAYLQTPAHAREVGDGLYLVGSRRFDR